MPITSIDTTAYDAFVDRTAVFSEDMKITYPTLGLNGETGEFTEKVKKMIRDDGGILKHERRMAMAKELGDVLWYLTACAHGIGFNLGDILHMNVAKLEDRKERNGTLKGDGDDR